MGNFEEKLKQAEAEFDAMRADEEFAEYIPEYNPNKYKKAIHNVKSLIVLCLALGGIFTVYNVLNLFLFDGFVVNVNGVPKTDYFDFVMYIGIIWACCGLPALFLNIVKKRLVQAHDVFATEDEQERLEKHIKFSGGLANENKSME